MVLRCVVYGYSNKKDDEKGISIHQIPFYGDTRAEAVKRRRKWVSFVSGTRKHWTPSKYSVVCSVHFAQEDFTRTFSFDQQCYQKRLKRDEIGVLPVPKFYRPKVEDKSTRDRRLHRRSVRFLTSHTVHVVECALPSIVLYFPAADRSDHLFRQTVLNPGCSVTHRGGVSSSRKTAALSRDSTHLSISLQQRHSARFCKRANEQLPHVHLRIEINKFNNKLKFYFCVWKNC